jgi:hypothetical protein
MNIFLVHLYSSMYFIIHIHNKEIIFIIFNSHGVEIRGIQFHSTILIEVRYIFHIKSSIHLFIAAKHTS